MAPAAAAACAHSATGLVIDWSGLPAIHSDAHCIVVMPVRNEALHIRRALRALGAQCGIRSDSFEVLVLANNCTDDTAARARAFAQHPDCRIRVLVVEAELPAPFDNVGTARGVLMERAAQRLASAAGGTPGHHAILSTDGDTSVGADWLAANLRELGAGADAVGGRIYTERAADWPIGLVRAQRLDEAYLLLRSKLESLLDPDAGDPWPRHHQHFSASLAISLRAYRRVGGLPQVPHLEDMALVRALRRADCVLRHSPAVMVRTSGRLDGRAEVGLSWQLRQWARGGASGSRLVADPADEARCWQLRRRARAAWRLASTGTGVAPRLLNELGAEFLLAPQRVGSAFEAAATFGELWDVLTAACQAHPRKPRVLPLDDAIRWLRAAVRDSADRALWARPV